VQTPADASGTVTFSSDTNQVQGSAPIQGGYATLTSLSTTLAVGTHPLSASWPGDAHYNPGQSNPVVVTVSNPVSAKK
jgi:Bacterial Ig-like domain (group 3)